MSKLHLPNPFKTKKSNSGEAAAVDNSVESSAHSKITHVQFGRTDKSSGKSASKSLSKSPSKTSDDAETTAPAVRKLSLAPTPSVTVRAPGKVNLALHIAPLGADGYHPLVTIFQAVDLYEQVTATLVKPGTGIKITVAGPGADQVPLDKTNLVHKAATALAARLGIRADVALHIEKGVPVAGGMAGGSADAAATLVACNELWESGLNKSALMVLAAELGSDVPFALMGGTAVGTGRGQQLHRLLVRGAYHWAFACQAEGLSTPAVYRKFDDLANIVPSEADAASYLDGYPEKAMLSALLAGDPVRVGAHLTNDLQAAALELRPELVQVLRVAESSGALGTMVSGSGPTVAALARSASHAQQIAAAWEAGGLAASTIVTAAPAKGAHII